MGLTESSGLVTVLRHLVIHLCVQLPVVTCHLFDFMLLRDERDGADVRVVKRAVKHTHHLMQRCNISLHKTPALKKSTRILIPDFYIPLHEEMTPPRSAPQSLLSSRST